MAYVVMSDPNAVADAKAKIKRTIREQLAGLPLQARADVLADLRLELAEDIPAEPPQASNGEEKPDPPWGKRHRPKKGRKGTGAVSRAAQRRGTPYKPRNADGPTAATFAALKAHPKMPITDLMKAVYPDDTSGETHKVRAILFSLKRQGRVKRVGQGLWEVTDKE